MSHTLLRTNFLINNKFKKMICYKNKKDLIKNFIRINHSFSLLIFYGDQNYFLTIIQITKT